MEVRELLLLCVEKGASDLHLTEGEPPLLRIDGTLHRTEQAVATKENLKKLIYSILTVSGSMSICRKDVLRQRFGVCRLRSLLSMS
jgi:Tfp pilus assembly pilus retraction ATPase PilT